MATPLLISLRNLISSSVISKLNKRFDENEALLRKSLDASICTILIGLDAIIENKTLYDSALESISASQFYDFLTVENGKITAINNSFEEEGQIPLNLIFSNKKGRISEMISNEIGIKSETAHAVFNFAVMVTFSHLLIEKQKIKNIKQALIEEQRPILSAIPEGLRVILGYSHFDCGEEFSLPANHLKTSRFTANVLSKIFKL